MPAAQDATAADRLARPSRQGGQQVTPIPPTAHTRSRRLKRISLVPLICICMLLIAEGGAFVVLRWKLPQYELLRLTLLGEQGAQPRFQNCVAQPYLLYVPAPGYQTKAGIQHNEQGYRGPSVPMARTPGVARVLCMGGSTTYGWGVPRAEETYPARLRELLEQQMPPGARGVEVINAGLPFGTSAEIVTHYHFKFHYYRPDVVVINTGGNDAAALCGAYYQPDYSHWRRCLHNPEPLPAHGRWLMHSRFAALLFIPLFHSEYLSGQHLIRPPDLPPPTPWFPQPGRSDDGPCDVDDQHLAFVHNLETALREMVQDGARVVLVPFRPAPGNHYDGCLLAGCARHESILERLAAAHDQTFARFSTEVVSPRNWVDDCHLNAEGELEKARYLTPTVARVLWDQTEETVRARHPVVICSQQ